MKLSEPSIIHEVNYQLTLIYGWLLRKENLLFDLVYRGSRDGYSLQNFHNKLDGKGPLIFFIKSAQFNKVFGGYTSKPWTTPTGDQ